MDDADRTEARREAEAEMERMRREAKASLPVVKYETCVDCEEPISEVRQNICAMRCFDCQSKHERRNGYLFRFAGS